MKFLSFLLLLGLSCLLCAASPQQQGIIPPEPPMVQPARKIDAAKLNREADELKKLAERVQEQIHSVGNGQLPANLPKNLKRIQELTHQLRLQLSR